MDGDLECRPIIPGAAADGRARGSGWMKSENTLIGFEERSEGRDKRCNGPWTVDGACTVSKSHAGGGKSHTGMLHNPDQLDRLRGRILLFFRISDERLYDRKSVGDATASNDK